MLRTATTGLANVSRIDVKRLSGVSSGNARYSLSVWPLPSPTMRGGACLEDETSAADPGRKKAATNG
jgi:hypothetical protein